MMMALIHDIVEIDAGDTYAYDTKGLETQKEREERAAERIFGMLPEDQRDELRALFEEFEACESAEARFAKVMDNFQPLLLNHSNDGADWREHKVSKSKVVGRQQTSSLGSEEIWKYTDELINANVKKGKMRGKTRRAYKNDESGNRGDEKIRKIKWRIILTCHLILGID